MKTGCLYIMQAITHPIEGLPFSHSLKANDGIACVLLVCFLLTTYVLSNDKRNLTQQLRDFFYTRERSSIFNQQTASEMHHRLLLILQTCILTGLLFLNYNINRHAVDSTQSNVLIYLLCYTAILLIFLLLKWALYQFINWIFFDNTKNQMWIQSYFFILSILGIVYFPLALIAVYCNSSAPISEIGSLLAFVFMNFLLFYKSFSIFFNNMHGFFYLIVYFCTLEILPILILWKGSILINSILTLKI